MLQDIPPRSCRPEATRAERRRRLTAPSSPLRPPRRRRRPFARRSARAQEGGGGTSSHKFSFSLPHLFGEHGGRWTPALVAGATRQCGLDPPCASPDLHIPWLDLRAALLRGAARGNGVLAGRASAVLAAVRCWPAVPRLCSPAVPMRGAVRGVVVAWLSTAGSLLHQRALGSRWPCCCFIVLW